VITAPIVGATKLPQLDDAIASVNVSLSDEEIASLEEPYVPHAVVGFHIAVERRLVPRD
jgi:aryl-alcohol dehydrogenase-like predicted oxidoreductase